MTRRRSNRSSVAGRRSSAPRDGRSTSACQNAGRDAAAAAPSAPASLGTSRQPMTAVRSRDDPLDERPRAPLAADAIGAGTEDDPGSRAAGDAAAALPRDQLQDRPIQRECDAGAVARLAVRAERPAMGQGRQPGERERQDPVPRSAAGIGHEPHTTGVVLEARVVEGVVAEPCRRVRVDTKAGLRRWRGRPPPRGVSSDRPPVARGSGECRRPRRGPRGPGPSPRRPA